MVIGIFGESCVGKSTLAELLKEKIDAQVYSGKDYLRLNKNDASKKHGLFNEENYNFHYHSNKDNFDFACDEIVSVIA